jgi:hypothetical protein
MHVQKKKNVFIVHLFNGRFCCSYSTSQKIQRLVNSKSKIKGHPRIDHEGPEGRSITLLFL